MTGSYATRVSDESEERGDADRLYADDEEDDADIFSLFEDDGGGESFSVSVDVTDMSVLTASSQPRGIVYFREVVPANNGGGVASRATRKR